MKNILRLSALLVALPIVAAAQSQPPAPLPKPPVATPPAPSAARSAQRPSTSTLSYAVQVTDKSGNGISDVAVALSGPVERSGRTAADGTVTFAAVRTGTYRLRFEHERYITLERDVTAGPRAADVSVALNPAPAKAVPVTPPPAPAAPPPVQPQRTVEPRTLSIIDFLDKNMIGSEPQKTSLLACTDGGTARILQVKDPMTNQVNNDSDQILYVIGGSGIVRVGDRDYKATAGWFALIPRTVPLGARRDGRNPLVALTAALGAPCAETASLAR